MKTVSLNFKLSEDLRDRFNKMCEEKSKNRSSLMRQWIETWVREQENNNLEDDK